MASLGVNMKKNAGRGSSKGCTIASTFHRSKLISQNVATTRNGSLRYASI